MRSVGHVIAKVEPLTPARSLRGPFDYLLGAGLEGVGVGSMLVVPFGRRRLLGVVVDLASESDVPAERLVAPLSALEADVPETLVRLGLWVAREYVSTPARGLALVLPPGTGTGAGRPLVPRRSLRAGLTDEGRAALDGEGVRLGLAPARGARGAPRGAGERVGRGAARRGGPFDAAQPRAARARVARPGRRRPSAAADRGRRRPRGRCGAHRGAERGARGDRRRASRRRSGRCCCTA